MGLYTNARINARDPMLVILAGSSVNPHVTSNVALNCRQPINQFELSFRPLIINVEIGLPRHGDENINYEAAIMFACFFVEWIIKPNLAFEWASRCSARCLPRNQSMCTEATAAFVSSTCSLNVDVSKLQTKALCSARILPCSPKSAPNDIKHQGLSQEDDARRCRPGQKPFRSPEIRARSFAEAVIADHG